jgi:hypothetical protein
MRSRETRRLGNLGEQLPHRGAVEFRGTLGVEYEAITISGTFRLPSPQRFFFIKYGGALNLQERLRLLQGVLLASDGDLLRMESSRQTSAGRKSHSLAHRG